MPRPSKLQRWTDLLAALLRYRFPVSREQLWTEVPAYAGWRTDKQAEAAVQRMFERDKDELRALGVPLETVKSGDEVVGYRLRPGDFYLPFLQLARDGRAGAAPRRPRGDGYASLSVLAFPPEELEAVVQAAHRVTQLGDPVLAADADLARRKLAHDLPAVETMAADATVAVRPEGETATFEALADALRRRKRVTFDYHSMGRDEHRRRTVEPLGLAFLSGRWYLVGHDPEADGVRQFRLGRIANAEVNAVNQQKADFEIPAGFNLSAHVASRQAWELGDGEAVTATVRFTEEGALAAAQLQLGEPVPGRARARSFVVRRPEPFARWLLSFAGAARPEGPASVMEAWAQLARATLAVYGEGA